MNCLNFGQMLNYKKWQIIQMAEQFEWRLFAVVVTYQQQGNYVATYHHWPCYRCYKIASCNNEEEERPNFSGFDDINEWFIQRDLEELRREALAWHRCNSKEERNKHVSSNHVRWTELLRLPYFNPIRHCVIDPMHKLFLGIAHWIVKRLWIDRGKISKE